MVEAEAPAVSLRSGLQILRSRYRWTAKSRYGRWREVDPTDSLRRSVFIATAVFFLHSRRPVAPTLRTA